VWCTGLAKPRTVDDNSTDAAATTERGAANPMTVRLGTIGELDRFADFWLAMFEEIGMLGERDMTPQWRSNFVDYFRMRIERREAGFFVADDGSGIAGTAGGLIADGYPAAIHGRKRGYVFGVRVAPAYRRRGLAERLTTCTIDLLHEFGCSSVRLHASPFGRRIYERLGFVPTNEMELRTRRRTLRD
jgi:ribosomal protein S18 acetylase RimI-like enzyme